MLLVYGYEYFLNQQVVSLRIMYAIRSYYEGLDNFKYMEELRYRDSLDFRITSYNVCYTKLLRTNITMGNCCRFQILHRSL